MTPTEKEELRRRFTAAGKEAYIDILIEGGHSPKYAMEVALSAAVASAIEEIERREQIQ